MFNHECNTQIQNIFWFNIFKDALLYKTAYLHLENLLELGDVGVMQQPEVVVYEGLGRLVVRHHHLQQHLRLRHPLLNYLDVTEINQVKLPFSLKVIWQQLN